MTHKGLVRDHNEDAMYYAPEDRMMLVCDGMGGHAGGHIASELAMQVVNTRLRMLGAADWQDEERVIDAMKHAIFEANDQILSMARNKRALQDMGTTIAAAVFMDDRVVFGHVGDSRIYRIADRQIEQLNEDHTLVAERIRAGTLDPESEEAMMLSSILTRALGMEHITVDILIEELCPGDIYLLCSDGLTDMLMDHELLEIINGHPDDPYAACATCIREANERGGIDNITVGITGIQTH
ncbi:MAG: PP2C family protein-serine/threonine phosphatase [Planctomycetota bacterium]